LKFNEKKKPNLFLVGKRIEILTNHFKIELNSTNESQFIYQFDVDVEILMRDGSWRSCKRDERFQVMKTIIDREKFPLVWYDQGKTLYSQENLTLKLKNEYECEITHRKTGRKNRFRFLLINLVKTYDLKVLFDFIQRRITHRPHDAVRILETLLKQTQRAEMVVIKNQFYYKNQRLDDLGDGRGLASGFYQAIILGQRGLTLNVNNTFTCFYQNLNLVEFISKFLGKDISRAGSTFSVVNI